MRNNTIALVLATSLTAAGFAQVIDGSTGVDKSSKKDKGKPAKEHKPSKPAKADAQGKAAGGKK